MVIQISRMKALAFIRSIVCVLGTLAAEAGPVIFIVRHAEKATTGGDDPDLSEQGRKRASLLRHRGL